MESEEDHRAGSFVEHARDCRVGQDGERCVDY